MNKKTIGAGILGTIAATILTVSALQPTNAVENAGFEEPFNHVSTNGVTFGEIYVPHDWYPFYCDFPYMSEPCKARYLGTKNPSDLLMGRPEYKIDFIRKQEGGSASQWFCFYRTCDAGLYQVVDTVPGTTYVFRVRLHSWSAPEGDWIDFNSHWTNEDGKANSLFMLLIDTDGGVDVYKNGMLHSNWYGLQSDTITKVDGIPIQVSNHPLEWVYEEITFTATGTRTTLFIRSTFLFPFPTNNSYADDAHLYIVESQATPTVVNNCSTPVATPVCLVVSPTPTVVAEQTSIPVEWVCPAGTNYPRGITTYVFDDTDNTGLRQNVRDVAGYNSTVIGKLYKGESGKILCTQIVNDDMWYMIEYHNTKLGWVLDIGSEH